MLPRVFIGSSVEAFGIADAVQSELEYVSEPTVWRQDVFQPGESTLQGLVAALDTYDLAVFVFAADDVAQIRESEYSVVRDNVIFEFGLFVGRLGTPRCFFLVPRGDKRLHLPSDLLGITPLTYAHRPKEWAAAVGPACRKIRAAVDEARQDRFSPAWLTYLLRGLRHTYLHHLQEHDQESSPPVRVSIMTPSRTGSAKHPLLRITSADYLDEFDDQELSDAWSMGQGKCGVAWEQSRQVVYAPEIPLDEMQFQEMGRKSGAAKEIRSLLSTPLMVNGTVYGILNIDSVWPSKRTLLHTEAVRLLFRDGSSQLSQILTRMR